ncbi:MAG: alpha/beta hydrolase [Alphaproteobacteria bacterium]|nr:alpha/beta hydrolase [Alphaproteobacteria bacterium]
MTCNPYEIKVDGQIEVDDFILKYTQEGNGPPAIVIGSHIYYPRTFSQKLREHLQLIFLDQRAFASRSNTETVTEEAYGLSKILEDIETLRLKLNLNKIIIIGHSIHAFMALEYAKRYPKAVSHILLLAASPITGEKLYQAADSYFIESVCPERKALLAENLKTLEQDTTAHPHLTFVTRMLKFGPMIWYDYTYDASHLWEGVHLNPIGAAHVWGSMFKNYPIEKNLNKIVCPVFLGLGRYDYWNPPYLWENFRSKFADLTIRIFEQSGHTPQREEPELLEDEILKWLKKSKT